MPTEPSLSTSAKRNVETIALVEQQLHRQRSPVERFGDDIARFFGSLRFIIAHLLFLASWIALNLGLAPGVPSFDPYPFPFLSFVVGIEFIFLTTFVLMNQKYQSRHATQWAHLTLQLSMLIEQEVTKNMQMLQLISHRLGVAQDLEANELGKVTQVTALVEEIEMAREIRETNTEVKGVEKELEADKHEAKAVSEKLRQDLEKKGEQVTAGK